MTLKEKIMSSELVKSGSIFTSSDMVGRFGHDSYVTRRALTELVNDQRLIQGLRNNKWTYRIRISHWINSKRLANYDPPMPAKFSCVNKWVLLGQNSCIY